MVIDKMDVLSVVITCRVHCYFSVGRPTDQEMTAVVLPTTTRHSLGHTRLGPSREHQHTQVAEGAGDLWTGGLIVFLLARSE